MEFLLVFGIHFLIMGVIVFLVSAILGYFFSRASVWIIVLLSMAAGFVYAEVVEVMQIVIIAVLFNGILSLLAIGLVKAGLYAKRKAGEWSK